VKPDFPEALNNLGSLLTQQGDRAEAISRFEAALRARPEFPEALNNLGFAHLQNGREGDAEPLFRRALELDPARSLAPRSVQAVGEFVRGGRRPSFHPGKLLS
jgi:Flp pilus assembly protein TadD